MQNMTEAQLTDVVLQRYQDTPDARLREILQSLIRHLHAFVRDVNLTEAEWLRGILYLLAKQQPLGERAREDVHRHQHGGEEREPKQCRLAKESERRRAAARRLVLGEKLRQAGRDAEARVEEQRIRQPEQDVVSRRVQAERPPDDNRGHCIQHRDERQEQRVPRDRARHAVEERSLGGGGRVVAGPAVDAIGVILREGPTKV